MRQNTTRAGVIGLIGLIAAAIVGCGPRENVTGDSGGATGRRERNAELPSTSLVNGTFTLGGGGWTSNGFLLGAGCQNGGGDPSLGGWQKDSLAFGYSRQTVVQTVRIMAPSKVTLRIVGAVRADQSASNFVISLSAPGQFSTTEPQSGSAAVTPQEFTLSVATRLPGDLVKVSIEGSSASYWGGCYGPIISNARLEVQPLIAPSDSSTITTTTSLSSYSSTTSPMTDPSSLVTSTSMSLGATSTSNPATTTSSIVQASTSTVRNTSTTSVPVASASATTTSQPRNPSDYTFATSDLRGDGGCSFRATGKCQDVAKEQIVGYQPTMSVRADLHGWKASGSDFSEANFSRANLRGSDLHFARWEAANIEYADLTTANLVATSLQDASASSAKFDYAKLNHADLGRTVLKQASLRDASMVGANLVDADLTDADLSRADLRSAKLFGVRSGGVSGNGIRLPSDYLLMNGFIVGPGVNLSNPQYSNWTNHSSYENWRATSLDASWVKSCAQVRRLDANKIAPRHANEIRSISFARLNLTESDFGGADLAGVNFNGANLTRVNFAGADLTGAKFAGATLTSVNLEGAIVSGVDFSAAKEFSMIRSGCTIAGQRNPVLLPKGWVLDESVSALKVDRLSASADPNIDFFGLRHGYLLGPTAMLDGANLTGLNLEGVDLRQATLSNVSSSSVEGVGVVMPVRSRSNKLLPTGYSWIQNLLVGPDTNLSGTVLSGFDLANLDLSAANLRDANWTKLRGSPLLPMGSGLINGQIVGPDSFVLKPNFDKASLEGIDLIGSTLVQPTFGTAKLAGLRTAGTKIVDAAMKEVVAPQLPTGYRLIGGYILGPGVNLTDSVIDLSSQRFPPTMSGIDLTTATLEGSRWRGVVGSPQLPKGWGLSAEGILVGPSASLADLTGSLYRGWPKNVTLPTGYALINGRLFGPRLRLADSGGAKVADLDISESSLAIGVLAGSNFERVHGVALTWTSPGKTIRGWGVTTRGVLVGPSADLRDTNLEGDLIPVSDLSGALLDGVRGVNVRFSSNDPVRLPPKWRFERGLLLGPTASLIGANLSGLKLDGVDLSNAHLTDARGTNIQGRPILPDGWSIDDGTLVGPEANLVCGTITRSQAPRTYTGTFGAYFDAEAFGVDPLRQPLC